MPKDTRSQHQLHSNSKKIQKLKPNKKAHSDSQDRKFYLKCFKDQKKKVINRLKELINPIPGRECSEEELLEGSKALARDDYNEILIKVFLQYTDFSLASLNEEEKTEKLKGLRRKVKGWITNREKPDNSIVSIRTETFIFHIGGGRYIPCVFEAKFKRKLIPVLEKLCCKHFETLSKKIWQICKQIDLQRKKPPSKHFWYDFLRKKKNEDVRKIYVQLKIPKRKCANHQDTDQMREIPIEEEQTQNSTTLPNHQDTDQLSKISIEEEQTQNSTTVPSSPDIYAPEELFGSPNSSLVADFQMQEATDDPNTPLSLNPAIQDPLPEQNTPVPRSMHAFEMNMKRALEIDCSSEMDIESRPDQNHTVGDMVEQSLGPSFRFLESGEFLNLPSTSKADNELSI